MHCNIQSHYNHSLSPLQRTEPSTTCSILSLAIMSPADSSPMKIPMVDFSAWANAQDKASRRRIAQELIEACQTVGFVYIVNHSLSGHAIDEAFSWSKQFFDLTKDVKMKAPHPEGWAIHRGYSWPGLEKVSQTISTGDDEETRKKLREIPDAKVCSLHAWELFNLTSMIGSL